MTYDNADYLNADDRGRVTLGQEFANSMIRVAWAELSDPEPKHLVEPTEDEKEKLQELYEWGKENGYSPINFDAQKGMIYTKSAEWINADVEGLQNE